MTTQPHTITAPNVYPLVCQLLHELGESEHTAKWMRLEANSDGIAITIERLTGEPGEPRSTELRTYVATDGRHRR